MKLVKSLLLGSVAGLAAVAGAQAADLPVKKAAAVDYVRVCSTYGAGYFFIPGSDTCLRISGQVFGEFQYLEQERDDFDETGFRTRFRANFDARQATEYGLLRAFARVDFIRRTGVYVSNGEGALGASTLNRAEDNISLSQGYVQFGGLTAGRAQSFFDFYSFPDLYTSQLTASDQKTQLFAYTFTFGGGFSATISAEDSQERRRFASPVMTATGFAPPPGTFFTPTATGPAIVNTFAPEGSHWPDVVGNLRLDQAWGSAQISGALHDLSAVNTATFGPAGTTIQTRADDEIGYALQAGVMFKLPFIAAGDELWLQATYADGASGYAGTPSSSTFGSFTTVRPAVTDAYIDRFGNVQTSQVFSVSGKFLHYWLPNLRSNFFGGYQTIEYDGRATTFVGPTAPATGPGVILGFADARIWEAGANLIWSPVKQLDIGVEAVYRNFEIDGGRVPNTVAATFGPTGAITAVSGRSVKSDDVWEARLRIQRDF